MNNSKSNTKKIAELGLLISLQILLTHFLSINTPIVRIGFGFLPLSVIGMLYGGFTAGICAVIADIMGILLFPTAPYFPGFTLTAFLTGLTYGILLYNKPKSWQRILISALVVCIIFNLGLDTLWLSIIIGKGYIGLLPTRILKTIIMVPIQLITISLVWDKFIIKIKHIVRS